MSIDHFKNTAELALDEVNPVAVPLGEPHALTRTHSVERLPIDAIEGPSSLRCARAESSAARAVASAAAASSRPRTLPASSRTKASARL